MFPQLRSDFVHIDGSDNMLISHGDKHSSDTEVSFEKRLQESRKEQNEVNMAVSDKDLSPNKPPKQKLPGYDEIKKKGVIDYKDMKVSYSDTTNRENYDINVKGSEDTDSQNEIPDSLLVSEETYLNKIDELLKTISESLDGQESNSETAKIRDILKSDVLQIKASMASGELSETHEVDAIKILQNIEKALNIKTAPLVVSEETYLNKIDELLKTILASLDGQQSNSETVKIRDILKSEVLQIKASIGSGKDMDIDLDNKLTKTLDQNMKQDIMKQDVRIDTAKNSGKPKDMDSRKMGIKNTDKMIAEKLTIMPEDLAQSDKVDKVNDSFVKEPGNNLKPYIMFNGNGEVSDIKSQVDIKKVDLRDIAGIKELVEHINIIKTSNGHKAVLDLSPENLGKLQVHITHENGKLVAKFIVDNEQAKQLLISNSEIIKQNLQQKGIDVSNMSFINLNENGYKEQSESREDVNKVELKGNHNKVSNNVEDNKLLKNGGALYA